MDISTPERIKNGTSFYFGEHLFYFGNEIAEFTDSSPVKDDIETLHAQMAKDGYIFIRGFHNRDKATAAAHWALNAISEHGGLKPNTPINEGIIGPENKNHSFFRQIEVAHGQPVLGVFDSPETFAFYQKLFGKPDLTFDKRWLRCMARGGHNHFHYDSMYVGHGTPNRYTM